MNPAPNRLEIRRYLPASRERVWTALTTGTEMCQWMGPGPCRCIGAECDVRTGGSYEVRMRVSNPGAPEEIWPVRGQYLDVQKPERLVFTWQWDGEPDQTQVTITLHAVEGGTDLLLVHERFGSLPSRDAHTQGWNGSFDKLLQLLHPGTPSAECNPTPVVGEFSWNELLTTDTASAERFYSELFGWKPAPFTGGTGYTLFHHGGKPAAGLMATPQPGIPPHWLSYVTVADCQAAVDRASALGATVCVPPEDVPTVGRIAVIMDPQGATLGFFQPAAS